MDDEAPDGWEIQDMTCPRCGCRITAAYPTGVTAIECGWCGFIMPEEPEERMQTAMMLPKAGNA